MNTYKYTNQSAFDHTVKHLQTMKGRCADRIGACQNRLPDGRACVVGSLLADEEAIFWPDGDANSTHRELSAYFGVGRHSLSGLDMDMLTRMQVIHDSEMSWDGDRFKTWGRVKHAAEKLNLTYNGPEV